MTENYEISFYTDVELIEELKRRHENVIVIKQSLRDENRIEINGTTNPKCGLANIPNGGALVALNMLEVAKNQIVTDCIGG